MWDTFGTGHVCDPGDGLGVRLGVTSVPSPAETGTSVNDVGPFPRRDSRWLPIPTCSDYRLPSPHRGKDMGGVGSWDQYLSICVQVEATTVSLNFYKHEREGKTVRDQREEG